MKIATYNVNGVNGRLPVLLEWLGATQPDVVCLQESPRWPGSRFQLRRHAKAVGLTFVAGPLYGYAQSSAADMLDGGPYRHAVLQEGIR